MPESGGEKGKNGTLERAAANIALVTDGKIVRCRLANDTTTHMREWRRQRVNVRVGGENN